MKGKNIFEIVILVLIALVLGGLIASWTADIPWLAWLTYGKSIGISPTTPMVIDLSMIRLTFGAELSINVVQIILLTAAYFVYRKWLH